MLVRRATVVFAGLILLAAARSATAQTAPPPTGAPATATTPPAAAGGEALRETTGQWRSPGATDTPAGAAAAARTPPRDPNDTTRSAVTPGRRPIAKVTQGTNKLPDENGQVWREYDISPYTLRATATNRPEQAIIDWILRETGYEAWHGEPVGVLSANPRTLKVYHTPEMHAVVADVVDRFVSTEAESQAFSMRVVTMSNPNWRARAQPMLRPLAVQTQGIQAWLVHKEDAAVMLAEMSKRMDFREYGSRHVLINNGQSSTITTTRPRMYVRDVVARPGAWAIFDPQTTQFDEGFSLDLNPLLSLDGRSNDAVIKCNIDQLEKLHTVNMDIATAGAPAARAKIEVPQTSQCRLHERFRWPVDEVLVVGLGVVPVPVPNDQPGMLGLPAIGAGHQRADLLIFVENKGRVTPSNTTAPNTPVTPVTNAAANVRPTLPPPPNTATRPAATALPERPNYSGRF